LEEQQKDQDEEDPIFTLDIVGDQSLTQDFMAFPAFPSDQDNNSNTSDSEDSRESEGYDSDKDYSWFRR
jgi:hypothetical protein